MLTGLERAVQSICTAVVMIADVLLDFVLKLVKDILMSMPE